MSYIQYVRRNKLGQALAATGASTRPKELQAAWRSDIVASINFRISGTSYLDMIAKCLNSMLCQVSAAMASTEPCASGRADRFSGLNGS